MSDIICAPVFCVFYQVDEFCLSETQEVMIVWQSDILDSPVAGRELALDGRSPSWITAEAQWLDGRRAFGKITAD